MSLHAKHAHQLPDSCFEKGTLQYLVVGNKGRVLDGRRTPGFIAGYDEESALFIWKITAFEDQGKCWEIPAEEITAYQFEKGSKKLSGAEVQKIESRCQQFSKKLLICGLEAEYEKTRGLIAKEKEKAKTWFLNHSQFVQLGKGRLDTESPAGCQYLYHDLAAYLGRRQVHELEQKTAQQYSLNPFSGEWVKGLRIVMAEMGLIDFEEKRPRTDHIFQGLGSKAKRRRYIVSRLAFLQSFLQLAGFSKVQLFRGMSTEGAMLARPRTLLSATFNPAVAKSFARIDGNEQITFSYVVKFTYPIENLFMTYLETKAFNERYQEQEAVIFYRNKFTF